MKHAIGFIVALLLCSGCFVALLVDMWPDLTRPTTQITIQQVESGERPPVSGQTRWHVTGGQWLVEHAVIRQGKVSTASYRKAGDVYTAYIPYASSKDTPLSDVRIEGRFVLGKSPTIDESALSDPVGEVYFASDSFPQAGPEQPLHPLAVAVYDFDAGKLPAVWLLGIPLIVAALVLLGMVRNMKRRKQAQLASD